MSEELTKLCQIQRKRMVVCMLFQGNNNNMQTFSKEKVCLVSYNYEELLQWNYKNLKQQRQSLR